MNTYSNLEQWAEEAFKKGREDHLHLVNALIPLEVQQQIKADVELGNISAEEAGARLYGICYADHVTTELQAEITQLRAKVAELEAENEDSRIFEIDGKQFLTTTQAAKVLCCHYSNVYRMAEFGVIQKPLNMGIKKKFLWLKSDIDGFVKSRMSEGGAA